MTPSSSDLDYFTTQRMSRVSGKPFSGCWSRSLAGRWLALAIIALAVVSRDCHAGGMAFDADGNLFLAAAESVFRFAPDGTKTTFATGLTNATSLTFDRKGNLFVADTGSKTAYRFAPDGTKS